MRAVTIAGGHGATYIGTVPIAAAVSCLLIGVLLLVVAGFAWTALGAAGHVIAIAAAVGGWFLGGLGVVNVGRTLRRS